MGYQGTVGEAVLTEIAVTRAKRVLDAAVRLRQEQAARSRLSVMYGVVVRWPCKKKEAAKDEGGVGCYPTCAEKMMRQRTGVPALRGSCDDRLRLVG